MNQGKYVFSQIVGLISSTSFQTIVNRYGGDWIKQHLKIKSFWGQSENAVKTQIWIAVSVYLLVAIAKKKFMLKQSLYELLQILSISIFEKMSINQLFAQTQLQYFKEQKCNQLKFNY